MRELAIRIKDISIHALREEGDQRSGAVRCPWSISIHALREEGDRTVQGWVSGRWYFYPRPPRGGRLLLQLYHNIRGKFLSTPSARRATSGRGWRRWYAKFLSTPSARRATCQEQPAKGQPQKFLSTPSARRAAQWFSGGLTRTEHFYPRPPRGGRRGPHLRLRRLAENFYPRPPRGGRRYKLILSGTPVQFLSTPSARRATCRVCLCKAPPGNFYPRPPRGGRRS